MKLIQLNVFYLLLILTCALHAEGQQNPPKPLEIVVYRSPTCGCCGKWIQYLRDHQFKLRDVVTDEIQAIKERYGVPRNMASCHTAIIDGYVVEGHVPVADIKRLLSIRPKVVGIAVPGMPVGTPGMEMGGQKARYQVLSFDENASYQVFGRHGE